jgi:hypothetical protein
MWELVGPVSNRYHDYHMPSLRHKYLLVSIPPEGHLLTSFPPEGHLLASSPPEGHLLASFLPKGQGSVSMEPLVRVPYVGTRHGGFQ